jgi:ABC-type phosphate/phosphonate transport system substrate-binding protein
MYDVTPQVRGHWHALLRIVADDAGVAVECIDHAAPAALPDLWARDDLALAFMCGLALATRYSRVRPVAAPVTVLAQDEAPTYRSVWLVRADSAFDALAATFGQRIGWMAEHSHSGCNAPRHALLAHRTPDRPRLYRESVGPLGHPRAVLAALANGRIDVVALDAYWWWLLQRHESVTASGFRAIGDTASAPMPPLVHAAGFPGSSASRLVAALGGLHADSTARPHLDALGVRSFAAVVRTDYAPLAEIESTALDAAYPVPA